MHWLVISFIFGVIEGLTEFIPVSSTGHMILAGTFLDCNNDKVKSLEVIIQLGSIIAVIKIFGRRLLMIGLSTAKYVNGNVDSDNLHFIHILLGILPTIVLGLFFYEHIKAIFEYQSVIYALIAGGLLLLVGEFLKPKLPSASNINDITYLQAFLIGCFQCLALWPGFSRSGATISGGLLVGVNRYAAYEFSFILAIPTILGATILDLYNNFLYMFRQDMIIFSFGFLTAFVFAFISIKYLLNIVTRISLVPFAIYRFIIAAVFYFLLD